VKSVDDKSPPAATMSALPAPAAWTEAVEWVFLVGSPRSGTTWLQAMLASHPLVYTGPETHFFELFARSEEKFRRSTVPKRHGVARYLGDEQFYAGMAHLFRATISALPAPARPPRVFLEKTPAHCLHADFIVRTFPRARFIHLIRDGRAVVASLLRLARGRAKSWAPKRLSAAARMWSSCVTAGRKIRDKVAGERGYLEVRYEHLRESPADRLAMIFEWLDAPADAGLLDSIVEANALENVLDSDERFPSITRVNPEEKKYKDRFFGSAACKPEEVGLSPLQRAAVGMHAGKLLRELGYAK
jgi:hypothetical protein